jgi:hypothetical protein
MVVLAGRYELVERLGRRGASIDWLARDRLLDRTVTVQLIDPDLADDAAFAARFGEATRRLASLEAPGIARLLDTGTEDGVPYLVRERCEGVTARAHLLRRGPLDVREAVAIGIGVLDALAPAHDAGILHLDLDLDDVVLVPGGGDVRVTNIGIEAAVDAGRVARAGEPVDDAGLDARADVLAVGALLFELLTGEAPSGRTSAREMRPDVPRSLDREVARALSPDAEERFPDVRAFASALARSDLRVDGAAPRRGVIRTWFAVPVAIGLAAAALIIVGLWRGELEVGGPLGIRPADGPQPATAAERRPSSIRPLEVTISDPYGDAAENDTTAPLAVDGDPATSWTSEGYEYPDGTLGKPGVGVVFDLGGSHDVTGFRLTTPTPGFVFHIAVGDDPATLEAAIGDPLTAEPDTRGVISGTGRYVLVWITTVVPTEDRNRAEIAEFRAMVDA